MSPQLSIALGLQTCSPVSIRASVLHHTHLGSLAQTAMFSQQTHYPLSGPLVPLSNVTLQFVASLIWRVLISSYFLPISPLFYFLNLCSLQMILLRLRLQPRHALRPALNCFSTKTFEIFSFQAQPRLNLKEQKGTCYLPKAVPPFSVITSSDQPGKSGQPVLLGRWESRPATGN